MKTQYRKKAREILLLEADAVRLQVTHLDDNFWKACEAVRACRGRVVVMGIGKSGLIGRKISATLASTGTPSFFAHPVETLHGDLGMLTGEDIVLALSYSGETEELNHVLPFLRRLDIPLLVMTARTQSQLARNADFIIICEVKKEACPDNIVPTSSTMAMMALGDTIALTVMAMKGFKREDFAKLHPGGALGRKLFLTVKDLMHSGIQNPHVRPDLKIRDVILTMTRCRLGATNIVDSKGKLIGFFTDGDLRRCLQKNRNLLDKQVGEIMTRRPCTVLPDMSALKAAQILKTHNFDNIPVVDRKGRSVGVLDERDLMREGIA